MKKTIFENDNLYPKREALKIVFLYLIFGFAWIALSDEILLMFKEDIGLYKDIQTYKGWIFVLLTAVFIYLLISNSIKKIKNINELVNQNLVELSATAENLLTTQEKLLQEKTLTDIMVKDSPLIVYTWDLDGNIKSLNPYGEKITGYKEEEIIGKAWEELFSYENDIKIKDKIVEKIKLGQTVKNNIGNLWKDKNGKYIEFLWVDSPLYNKHGEITDVISFGTDITGQNDMLERLNNLAYSDLLTGLPNRSKLKMDSIDFIENAEKNNTKIGFLYIDIDNFKQINDSLGYDSGDKLLIHFANILKEEKKDKDYLAKLSEDEYGLIVKDIVEDEEINLIAKNVLEKIKEPWYINNNEFLITASIGIAIFPDQAKDFPDLMKCANVGMYYMKSIGKNGFTFYTNEMGERIANNTFMINQIKRAIDEEQFCLHYQPIINLSSDTLFGVEALLRWYHPVKGYIPPMDYIPLLEETGQIFEVTSLVIKMAMKQKSIWNQKGYPFFKVAINISSKSLIQGDIVDEIEGFLKEYKIKANEVSVEVTETAFMDNFDICINTMSRLDELGIEISLDDFGTGYSSLSRLKSLPIQYVKMDQEFIKTMIRYSEEEIVVRSIIGLSHTLGLSIVAEGIETKEQKDILIESGCELGQGYFLARPLTPDVLEDKFLYRLKVEKDD